MKEAAHLMAVHRILGGVQVQDQLRGGLGLRGNEGVDEHAGHREHHGTQGSVLQSAEGGCGGQGLIELALAFAGELEERIVAEGVVIIEIFMSRGEGEDALSEQAHLGVGDEQGIAWIGDGGVELIDELKLPVGLAQQEEASVTGECSAVKVGDDVLAIEIGKEDG
jgi:hypothetical protein